jgi:hypothetical protein
MGKQRSNYRQETHLFSIDSHCFHRYHELQKEARIWNNSGQYWLAKQCTILANQLLQGDASVINAIIKTEEHFYKTKKHIH